MKNSKDYKIIKKIIDEIIGIDTQQGNNLKEAIKNYFESKPINVKLPNNTNIKFNYSKVSRVVPEDTEANKALENYTKKLNKTIENLKKKNQYRGVSN